MPNNDKFLDLINALSLIIGIQNLQENREQSVQNDIHSENDKQAKYLLTEITKQFEEQNILLKQILERLNSLNGQKTSRLMKWRKLLNKHELRQPIRQTV